MRKIMFFLIFILFSNLVFAGWFSDDEVILYNPKLKSSDLDFVCSFDNSFLYRFGGLWGCGQLNTSQMNVTITYNITNVTYYELNESDPLSLHLSGGNMSGTIYMNNNSIINVSNLSGVYADIGLLGFNNLLYESSLSISEGSHDLSHINTFRGLFNHIDSGGVMHGADLINLGNGSVFIGDGYALLHNNSDPHDDMFIIGFNNQTLELIDNSANWIYIDFNNSDPVFKTSVNQNDFNCIDKCLIYLAFRDGNVIEYVDAREQNVDSGRKIRRTLLNRERFRHAEGGSVLGDAGGLAVFVTAGQFDFMLEEIPHVAFDTSIAGTNYSNVFSLYYRNGSDWVVVNNSKMVNSSVYDDGDGSPAILGNNKFGVTWFYVKNNEPSTLIAIMGQDEYPNEASAESAGVPSQLPELVNTLGSLVGWVVYEKGSSNFSNVLSRFAVTVTGSTATSHNNLAGLQGGSVGEYYHFNVSEWLELSGWLSSVVLSGNGNVNVGLGNVTASNFFGFVNASFVSNPYWVNSSGLNDTLQSFNEVFINENSEFILSCPPDDMMTTYTNTGCFLGAQVNSGTQTSAVDGLFHPGVKLFRSVANGLNSGYQTSFANNALVINGSETYKVIVNFPELLSGSNASVTRLGFTDSVTVTNPTDGMFFNISGNSVGWNITGITRNNTGTGRTSSYFVSSVTDWYKFKIVVNSNASLVSFYIYNSSDGNTGLLWSDNLSTNIPKGASRVVGANIFTYLDGNTSSSIIDLLAVDFLDVKLNRVIVR